MTSPRPDDLHLRSLIAKGWVEFKTHAGLSVAALASLFLAWVTLEVLVVVTHELGAVVNFAIHFVYLVAASGLELGFVRVTLEIVDGKSPVFSDLFGYMRRGPHFLAAKLLYLLLLALGLISLGIPGLWLGTRYSLFPGLMADGQRNPVEALKASSSKVRGRTGRVFLILLALLLLNVLGACLLGLGLLVTIPTTMFALANLYRQLGRDTLPPTSAT